MDAAQALLGAWTAADAQNLDALLVWRWEVSSHSCAAWQATHADLNKDYAYIEQVAERLSRFADVWQPDRRPRAKSLEEPTRPPEDALAAALERLGTLQAKGLLDSLHSAQEELNLFIRRVCALASHYAVIETQFNGTVMARTLVSWTGDFRSLWRDDLTPEQLGLHMRNVRAALARRAMLIRLMSVISTSAAKIVLRLATPGAQLLVLPALWQFIRDVIEELRRAEAQGPR
ncbi:MAG: hypothetical protein KatS3mg052_2455 [Candidatus Roseilinea sp.]|nr:MAG: hypothetical protein KatS3mg052_2455 [Candidatus Roseilinea sp.]